METWQWETTQLFMPNGTLESQHGTINLSVEEMGVDAQPLKRFPVNSVNSIGTSTQPNMTLFHHGLHFRLPIRPHRRVRV